MKAKFYKFLPTAIFIATANLFSIAPLPAQALDCSAGGHPEQENPSCNRPSIGGPSIEDNDAELTTIPGTSVSLSPPPGFVLSDRFSGFINPETLSSIVLVEMPPEAYPELASMLSSTPQAVTEAFSDRGIVLVVEKISSISLGTDTTPFVQGVQVADGMRVTKYFALLKGDRTILLTFNVIEPDDLSEETIIETIQSVSLSPAPSIEQKIAELPFTLEAIAPFQVLDVIVGSSVVLNLSGERAPLEEEPLIIIANSTSPITSNPSETDLADYSSQLLQNTSGFSHADITEQSTVDFAGGEGYLIQALLPEANQQEASQQEGTKVLQYLRILPNGFHLRMIVLGDSETLEELTPAIQAIQRSVEPKP
ncbi:MAG: hypothetical protein AAGC93_25020 [Cyanobacteria bacterium P01_F01_bin.53]